MFLMSQTSIIIIFSKLKKKILFSLNMSMYSDFYPTGANGLPE